MILHCPIFGQVLECPELIVPSDGATDVPVSTNFEWSSVDGATGFIVRIGTTSGGSDILEIQGSGSVTQLNPEADLPPFSDIYITIAPINDDSVNTMCEEFSFTTGMTNIPRCTEIINPRDGDELVPVNQNITWIRDFTATGYLMTVAERDPDGILILDNEPVGNGTNFKPPNFKPRTRYYVTITPFNEAGEAENCQAISFTTGDPLPTPDCADIVFPANGATDIPQDLTIEWTPVADVDGYLLSIGTTLAANDIINNLNMNENTQYELPNELPEGIQIYVKVASYKDGETSESCPSHSFFTIGPEIVEAEDFIPKFFTPNSDGINDEWKIKAPENISVSQIFLFDRYGKLLKELHSSQGWDGTINGRRLPAGSYWYAVRLIDATQIRGFFALKR